LKILALAGGVGGAKLAKGLAEVLRSDELTVIVNTGDDFEHLGLCVSPDLDTVMYTLAGINDPEVGWGVAGDTWNFMAALERLGGETWFRLGDRDLATNVERTRRLRAGESLSSVTELFCRCLGIETPLAPMSDNPVRTAVSTDTGRLAFQDYFVRQQAQPRVESLAYEGAPQAVPSAPFRQALKDPNLRAIVICPSNPYLSIGPILAIAGVRDAILQSPVPVVAISPIVGGLALKGPAAKIMAELGFKASALTVARFYGDLIDALIVDHADRSEAPLIEACGVRAFVTETVMRAPNDRARLARSVIAFCHDLAPRENRVRAP
jgi:LPPG:FO 2-phospho-L-lactate transferase